MARSGAGGPDRSGVPPAGDRPPGGAPPRRPGGPDRRRARAGAPSRARSGAADAGRGASVPRAPVAPPHDRSVPVGPSGRCAGGVPTGPGTARRGTGDRPLPRTPPPPGARPPSGSLAGHRGGAPPRVPTARAGRSGVIRIGPSGLPAPGRPGGGDQDDQSPVRERSRVHQAVRSRGPAGGSARASPRGTPLRLLAGTVRRLLGDAVPPRGEPPGAPGSRAPRPSGSGEAPGPDGPGANGRPPAGRGAPRRQ